jgi:hypothetical protein
MHHHIPLETVDAIRRLHQLDWSQQAIARHLGVCATTVHRVIHGTWSPVVMADDPFAEERLQAKRCGGCGGRVYEWPCRTCQARATLDRQRRAA